MWVASFAQDDKDVRFAHLEENPAYKVASEAGVKIAAAMNTKPKRAIIHRLPKEAGGDTCKEFIKLHRIPREAILKLLWDVSAEWQEAVGSLPPGMHHALVSTFEIDGKPILDTLINEKRARKWLVKNGYDGKHQPQKRQAIPQWRAAKLIGVSEKEIARWDKGKHRPLDYPGRNNARALNTFADKYRKEKDLPTLQLSEYLPKP